MGPFGTKTPQLPELESVDEIINELDVHLDRARELVEALRQKTREAESDQSEQ